MATKVKVSATASNPVDVLSIIREAEKVAKIQTITIGMESRISTGILCTDIQLGGGLAPGMYTFAGGESSAKTTTALVAMAASINQDVGLRVLWDAEGSSGSSTDYIQNIVRTVNPNSKLEVETLFGVRDTKGNMVQAPVVYYRDESELEVFFDWFAAFLRRMPDKRCEDGKWWYIFPWTDENKAKYKDQMDVGRSKVAKLVYIPAEDSAPQALIILDSWANLLPSGMDEDEVKGAMALLAREFSKHLPRVKGKLRRKRVILLGMNQLREKPGFTMGSPIYESGGNSLKFNSDARVWHTARSLSGVPYNPKGKGMIEEEPSVTVEGGIDTYRYIHTLTKKNKLSAPNRETWLRLWVQAADGKAYGVDPVFDLFHALVITGQASGRRSSILLNVDGLGEAKKNIDWLEFKRLVLGTKEEKNKVLAKIGYKEGVDLRSGVFKMSKRGRLEELYIKNKLKGTKAVPKESLEDAEDDDGE
jgi:RecA/RadA recombinase